MTSIGPGRALTISLSLFLAVTVASPAAAATFEPTRLDDPPPGNCKPSDCSLREALKAANAADDRDLILLSKGTYEMEIPDESSGMDSGSFDLVKSVTIRGRSTGSTTVDANGLDQVMTGWLNLADNSFKLESLMLTGGDAEAGSQNSGGAIIVAGEDSLALSQTSIVGNSAPASGGGVALVNVPKATIKRSVINDNSAPTGGGIAALGTTAATVKRSEITENDADFGGGIASTATDLLVKQTTVAGNMANEGAGFDLRPAAVLPVTRISSSTIFDNYALNKGGGVMVDGLPSGGPDLAEDPEVHIVNSTLDANKANNDGGGVVGDNLATVDIENSSIGFNRANMDGAGTAVGGGVFQHGNAAFSVDDSVLASNGDGAPGGDDDCSAAQVFSGAGNVINSTTGCELSFTTPFNLYSATLIANESADNGGPTKTMKIPGSSAAVGFANNCPKLDQRGLKRPADCDSGAYENKPVR
jgi:hypothetical protein